jgi:hypothetical protein
MSLKLLAVVLLFGFSTCSQSREGAPGADLKKNQPPAVAALIDRIIDCNHWLGESPYNAGRAEEINAAVAELGCSHLADDEATILAQFPGKASVKKAIVAAHDISL